MDCVGRSPQSRRQLRHPPGVYIAGLVLLWLLSGTAQAQTVLVVLSGTQPVYQRFQAAFSDSWPQSAHLQFVTLDRYQPGAASLVVAVGSEATRTLLDQPLQAPLLSVLSPKAAVDRLFETHLEARDLLRQQAYLPVYFDQPLQRRLNLIRLIQPDLQSIGTALGPLSRQWAPELRELSAAADLQLNLTNLQENDNPLDHLIPVIEKSDAFLVLADRSSFNRATARWILLLSLRQQIPVFGYSRSYTDAGALASIYSTPEQVAEQAVKLVQRRLQGGQPWPERPLYPDNFSVSLNTAVTRRLGIPEQNSVDLEQLLKGMEQSPP